MKDELKRLVEERNQQLKEDLEQKMSQIPPEELENMKNIARNWGDEGTPNYNWALEAKIDAYNLPQKNLQKVNKELDQSTKKWKQRTEEPFLR